MLLGGSLQRDEHGRPIGWGSYEERDPLAGILGDIGTEVGGNLGNAWGEFNEWSQDPVGNITDSLLNWPPTNIPEMMEYGATEDDFMNAMDTVHPAGLLAGVIRRYMPPPRMSKIEAEQAGYWHPIGDTKKLGVPIGEMSRTVEDYGSMQPWMQADVEGMQGGLLIPGTGDRTEAGKRLLGVNDIPLDNPVLLEGGHDFMRANPESVWASDKGRVTTLINKARRGIEAGQDPYLWYMPMGHKATNYSTMMTDTMLEMIRGNNVSKTAKTMFDRELRKLRPEWSGISSPEAHKQLLDNGALRHAFSQVAQKDDYIRRGFPDQASVRYGLTDPGLLDVPNAQGGQAIARLSGETVDNPMVPHRTYNTQMGGEYYGGIPGGVPRELVFPSFYKERRLRGTPETGDSYSFERAKPTQEIDQEWIDRVMGYLSRENSLLGY